MIADPLINRARHVSFPKIRSSRGHNPAVHDKRCAPGDYPAIVEKIVADNRKLRLVVATRAGIGDLAGLDESVQIFLAIFEPHAHISGAPGLPKEVKIIPKTLMLIERGDRAIHAVAALEADRRVDLTDRLRLGIEEILQDLAKLEVLVERDRQWLRFLDLVGLGRRAGATREKQTKDGQEDSHDASIKREVRLGVNRVACIEGWSNRIMEIAHREWGYSIGSVGRPRRDRLIFRRDCGAIRARSLFA
jgi:hypothetical protein